MDSEHPIKKETIEEIRNAVIWSRNPDKRNIYMGENIYSLREMLEQVEQKTPDGIAYAQAWEEGQEKIIEYRRRRTSLK